MIMTFNKMPRNCVQILVADVEGRPLGLPNTRNGKIWTLGERLPVMVSRQVIKQMEVEFTRSWCLGVERPFGSTMTSSTVSILTKKHKQKEDVCVLLRLKLSSFRFFVCSLMRSYFSELLKMFHYWDELYMERMKLNKH